MNKPLLSIIIPVMPNRQDRLAAILSRLCLNQSVFPDHTFEVVVIDGGATDNTRDLCMTMAQYINLKYIYVPICGFICASYPRNIGFRVCEADVIGMIDIDHWPSENIVYGMLNPFIDDREFRVVLINDEDKIKNRIEYLNDQCVENKPNNIINRGYVVDSSKSIHCTGIDDPQAEILNRPLLNPNNSGLKILSVYHYLKIPPPGMNNTLWIWSVKRENIVNMNFQDEIYCQKGAYSREDDDFRERLLAQGLRLFDGQNQNFCAIHLNHPAAQRHNPNNKLNREYFEKSCMPVTHIKRNIGWSWGKLIQDSFSVINGITRTVKEHEEWIKENIKDVPSYINDVAWTNADNLVQALDIYIRNTK